ncbi:MAG TPA: NAD(P)H-dependent oxidoreductase subunit E [Chloroflexota bacterium]|nr:NAD(P)H-dependent oxidoreductase subunit E [Chloroflexota bacterium]
MSGAVLSEATRDRITELMGRYPHPRSALLPSLYLVQEEKGFVSEESMAEVGDLLHLTAADVKSVASYYTMFAKKPVGRHMLEICTNLACKARDCDAVVSHVLKTLNVELGATTADGRYTVEEVECLGQCEFAPMIEIDLEPIGPLNTPEKIDAALARYS